MLHADWSWHTCCRKNQWRAVWRRGRCRFNVRRELPDLATWLRHRNTLHPLGPIFERPALSFLLCPPSKLLSPVGVCLDTHPTSFGRLKDSSACRPPACTVWHELDQNGAADSKPDGIVSSKYALRQQKVSDFRESPVRVYSMYTTLRRGLVPQLSLHMAHRGIAPGALQGTCTQVPLRPYGPPPHTR